MGNRIFGYVGVSSTDQNKDRQLLALNKVNIPAKNIYIDKLSVKDFNRPQYKKMKRKLRSGDLLYILSIDRMGCNYEEIQNLWRILTRGKQLLVKVTEDFIVTSELANKVNPRKLDFGKYTFKKATYQLV